LHGWVCPVLNVSDWNCIRKEAEEIHPDKVAVENKFNVIVIGNHPIIRIGVASILLQSKDIRVGDEIYGEKTALLAIEQQQPDVVVLDIDIDGFKDIDLIAGIKTKNPTVIIVVYTAITNSETIIRALRLGAIGYILKTDPLSELENAIRYGLKGSLYLSPTISMEAVQTLLNKGSDAELPLDCLTKREHEVARLLSRGLTAQMVGETLYISPKTVRIHRRNIMNKLSCEHPNVLLLTLLDLFSLPTH
jgi:DNA-binding NarL/FixJ family response regulator